MLENIGKQKKTCLFSKFKRIKMNQFCNTRKLKCGIEILLNDRNIKHILFIIKNLKY
jgi:hypothetical protein